MKIDYEEIKQIKDSDDRFQRVKEILRNISDADQPYLTDAIVRAKLDAAGSAVMQVLAEMEAMAIQSRQAPVQWILRAVKDEWGNEFGPGDIVERVIPINRKNRKGQPVTGPTMEAALMDGTFSEQYEKRIPFPVDEKGCIRCSFSDAGYFLSNWGYHGRTKHGGVCQHKQYSAEPVETPNGKGKLHVHYWRFWEVAPEDYAKLPNAKPSTDKDKRGK